MKVIIAGSRHIEGIEAFELVMDAVEASGWSGDIDEVVSGGAPGIDTAGEKLADGYGLGCKVFSACWELHGKAAGPIRNEQMAQYADALIAIPKPGAENRGTNNMIETARRLGLKVYVHGE